MQDFLTDAIDSGGYLGVALLMLLENLLPPIPSEVVMPGAGAAARAGEMSLVGVILAGTAGSVAGALPWYGVARWIGTERFKAWIDRHGHWLGTDAHEIQRMDDWFDRWGTWAVLACRLVPGVRTLISVPAGLAEMPLAPFLLATTLGTAAWTALLACLGYWLQGQDETLVRVLNVVGMVVVAGLFVAYVTKVVRHRPPRKVVDDT